MNTCLNAAIAVTLTGLIAACGGGGAGGDASSASSSQAITASNGSDLASQGYQAANSIYNAGSVSGGNLMVSKSADGGARLSLVGLALSRIESVERTGYPAGAGAASGAQVAAQGSFVDAVACQGGGSIQLSVDDPDGDNALSTGDSVVFRFDACRESGLTVSGQMSFTQIVITGTPTSSSRSVGATIAFSPITSTNGTDTETIEGAFSFQSALQTQPSIVVDATVTGDSMVATVNGRRRSMRAFDSSIRVDRTAGRYRHSLNATLDAAGVRVATPVPFEGSIGAFPSSGTLTVTDVAGRSASLYATSATSVRIDLDVDGNGSVDSSVVRTWAQVVSAD
ncbi:MAG: hypothetical protein AB7P21_15615 [Lautropia sp.]